MRVWPDTPPAQRPSRGLRLHRTGEKRHQRAARLFAVGSLSAATVLTLSVPAGAATPASASGGSAQRTAKPTVVYRDLKLVNGDTATVYSSGLAEIFNPARTKVEYRNVTPTGDAATGTAASLPSKPQLIFDLVKAPAQAYVPGEYEMVLANTVSATQQTRLVPRAALARHEVADYTTNSTFNRLLASLGVDQMSAVFPAAAAQKLKPQAGQLNLAKAYVLHVTSSAEPAALDALTGSASVAYAAPDWTVSTTATNPVTVPAATVAAAKASAQRMAAQPAKRTDAALPALPANYALSSSEQSLLNRPGVNWAPAYEQLESKYHQLPGTGEIITDVSLTDLTSAGIPSTDPCYGYESAYGPTSIIQNGQRYIDWPSMPLIPAWTSSVSGALDPTGEVCGEDPQNEEVGLDFAMMAPLPHNLQRPGESGSGLTDLLGIAPGAKYRLVVTSDSTGATTSIDQSFLAAAQQTPKPNVITASLAFGLDSEGFPSRFLEDDPLTESLLYSIVHQYKIVVSVSANDGLRTSTNAPVSPSGGSAATNVAKPGSTPSNLNSIQFSTGPSSDYDSGSIDAGGTTLDDISAAPPQNAESATLASQHAFPETRYDGYGSFSSGYGSRVNVSAPSDNLVAFEHTFGGAADAVTVDNIGGTSGSSQEVGAAAAVVQQAARLAGNTSLADNPLGLRSELEKTATAVPATGQQDTKLNVGPQVNLGNAVSAVLGSSMPAGVARVAVEQRQAYPGYLNEVFSTNTDPSAISLAGVDQDAYITLSPDWVGLPAGATYRLSVSKATGGSKQLGTGPWTRLLPTTILAAAGLSDSTAQTVSLSYSALSAGKVIAHATIPLSFSAASGSPELLAPQVPTVVTGATIPVHYNLTGQSGFTAPQLVVSEAGRMTPFDHFFRQLYTVALTKQIGTVNVPVSMLQGGGIYGIAIQATPTEFAFTDFAFTRVQAAGSDVSPPAPVLSAQGQQAGYLLGIPYGGKFSVSWNVTNVPQATGAYLEISAPGPGTFNSYASFNNPNGTIRDHNGLDSESVYFQPLPSTSGRITLTGAAAGLVPAMYSNVRVLPVTSSGAAAGESSDMSTISMDGVEPADGGSVVDGFGSSQSGGTGFVTSNQTLANGEPESSVDTFNQQTQAVTGTVISSTDSDSYSTLYDGGAGQFDGGAGVLEDSTDTSTSYDILNPVGTVAGPWAPPTKNPYIIGADNQTTSSTAFGTWNFAPAGLDHAGVFSSDVAAGTFGKVYSVQPQLSGFGYPDITAFGQDSTTNTAVVGATDFFNQSEPPTFINVNMATGKKTTFTGVGEGYAEGLAVDSTTGMMIAPDNSGVGIYNLANGSGNLASPGGFIYEHPAADPTHQEFVVQELSSPDANIVTPGLGSTPNNDALSSEVVLNEQGAVLSRVEQFNFYNTFTTIAGDLTQLEPASQAGYTFGPLGGELQPFNY
ncbi:MAG TPA: hypothetical protein VGH27_17085 [Streptosporangiaceae bacterium]